MLKTDILIYITDYITIY